MTQIEALLERLKAAGAKVLDQEFFYPAEAPEFGPGCHEAELEEIVGQWPFPPDYREYLLLCRRINAGDVWNGYHLFSPIGIVTTDGPRILHIDLGAGLDEVRAIPIGGDGGGNLFLMGRSPNANGFVWKWDHEHPTRFGGVAREGLRLLARSFSEFLERVAVDWEHFNDCDRDWDYISG